MKMNKKYVVIFCINIFSVCVGLLSIAFSTNNFLHALFVIVTSIALLFVVLSDRQNIVRPLSFFVLSFFVFLWMRIVLNVFFGSVVISAGKGITEENINIVTCYLGITECIMCCVILIVYEFLRHKGIKSLSVNSHIVLRQKWISNIFLMASILFLLLFLADSYKKIIYITSYDYMSISENIMLTGYRYFTVGKWFIFLWIIISENKNKFMIASTILVAASTGYLMRGARGYAICYIFLWIIIYSTKYKIKFTSLALAGFGLIFLANYILEYRLGFNVASGFGNIIFATLHQQGASIEPVFGSVVFKNELLECFSKIDLFRTGTYGLAVDKVRETGFVSGGFGSSFFAESFFLGFPFGFLLQLILAVCVGIMEYAYKLVIENRNIKHYAMLLIFMTTPNLIYFSRSSISDYVSKTFSTMLIILLLYTIEKKRRTSKLGNFI